MPTSNVDFPAVLPKAAVDALKKAIAKKRFDYVDLHRAFQAVDFPESPVPPAASTLTPAQRALAEVLTAVLGDDSCMSMPRADATRRRWLGLDPPGELEQDTDVTIDGIVRREPVWRALLLLQEADNTSQTRAFIDRLSLVQRLRLWMEIRAERNYSSYEIDDDMVFRTKDLPLLRDLDGNEARAWAINAANAATVEGARVARETDRVVIFTALLQLKVPIEPRWTTLVPVLLNDKTKLTTNALKALPVELRAPSTA